MPFTCERVQRRSGRLRHKAKIEVVSAIMKIFGAGCGMKWLRREFEGRIRDKTATRICRDCQSVEEPKNIPAGITFLSFSEVFIVDRISALQSRVSSQRVKVASCGIGMELLVWEGWRDEIRNYGGMRDAGLKKAMLEEVEICLLYLGNENYWKLFEWRLRF